MKVKIWESVDRESQGGEQEPAREPKLAMAGVEMEVKKAVP